MENYRERIYQYYVSAMEKDRAIDRDRLRSREPYLRHVIRNHFPQDRKSRVLDLGCGHGTLLHFCRMEGYDRVSGVDRSPQQVAKARDLGIEGVQEGDLMATLKSLPDASQDVVVAFDVIEHFSKEELLPFIDEVRRILKSAGRWIIHTPNGESPFQGRIRYGDFTHENIFTRDSIAQILLSSGFTDVRCFEDKPIVHGFKSLVRRALWAGIRTGLLIYLAAETGSLDRRTILTQNFLTVATR